MRVEVVTAVHPTYSHFLATAWHSLCAQTHTDWTWLVQIDAEDATSARTALIDCGAAADPRVRLGVNGTREGSAVTRNVALGRSSAEFIQNLDADDELEPTALATLAAALCAHPTAGFAVGTARDLLGSGEFVSVPIAFPPGLVPRGDLVDAWLAAPDGRLPVHPAGIMWRRDLLLTLGGWAAMRGMEDTALLISAAALAPCVTTATATLRYRRHRNQQSTQRSFFEGGGGVKSR
ncbi:glycosyltransferase [Nocardia sp. NPDC127579]|uniref:glycosyltransferase n=1 Tax=Nocardia sp. NPDC127579 TaxID=3345402 RepID=UPI003628E9F1